MKLCYVVWFIPEGPFDMQYIGTGHYEIEEVE